MGVFHYCPHLNHSENRKNAKPLCRPFLDLKQYPKWYALLFSWHVTPAKFWDLKFYLKIFLLKFCCLLGHKKVLTLLKLSSYHFFTTAFQAEKCFIALCIYFKCLEWTVNVQYLSWATVKCEVLFYNCFILHIQFTHCRVWFDWSKNFSENAFFQCDDIFVPVELGYLD